MCGGVYQVGELDLLSARAQAMLEGKLNCTDLVQAYMQAWPPHAATWTCSARCLQGALLCGLAAGAHYQ